MTGVYTKFKTLGAISTHTLTWSVTTRSFVFAVVKNFNSHAHVERDFLTEKNGIQKRISTHTLTWSVTYLTKYFCSLLRISTHTLTWSVTKMLSRINFYVLISTHTLTWSVTTWGMMNADTYYISTHTLTWSVTLDVVYIWCLLNVMRTYFFI